MTLFEVGPQRKNALKCDQKQDTKLAADKSPEVPRYGMTFVDEAVLALKLYWEDWQRTVVRAAWGLS